MVPELRNAWLRWLRPVTIRRTCPGRCAGLLLCPSPEAAGRKYGPGKLPLQPARKRSHTLASAWRNTARKCFPADASQSGPIRKRFPHFHFHFHFLSAATVRDLRSFLKRNYKCIVGICVNMRSVPGVTGCFEK